MNRSDSNSNLLSRRTSRFSVFSNPEEEKLIGEITTTSYEKVIRILTNLKFQLEDINFSSETISELNWVIRKIQSHTLYTYDLTEQSILSGGDNLEVNSLVEYLNDYSEVRDIQRRNRDAKCSKTVSVKPQDKSKIKSLFSKRSQSITFKQFDEIKESILIEHKKEEERELYDLKIISDPYFDIFDFEELVGNTNVFPFIAKYSYNTTNTMELINHDALDRFLERSRDGYNLVPYHNSLHGADVCQMMMIIITHSNAVEALQLSQPDVLSMLTAALLHDIGHPGTNNTYQINTCSEFAVSYNDKSVLENFHCAEGFRILLKPDSNIFSKLDFMTYRHIRKRMIEQILATDMMFHARTLTLVKNKLVSNNIEGGKNMDNIFHDVNNLFDEQQEVLNFIMHTCDIGHSAKPFTQSQRWTNNIMEEFWSQGDNERKRGIPISFLCDREKADVPKNQIVFIKSILVPDYDILIDMFPTLSFYKTNLENNVNHWARIAALEEKNKENNN